MKSANEILLRPAGRFNVAILIEAADAEFTHPQHAVQYTAD